MKKGPRPNPAPKARSRALPAEALAAALALFATLLSAWICRRVFEGIPHITDCVSYAFQARVFSSGRLCLSPPAVPEAFAIGNVVMNQDLWAGKYPPGFPALLSIGYLLGVP